MTEPAADFAAKVREKAAARYAVTFTDDKTPKLMLPAVPEHDDLPGQLEWITSVFQLDPDHPATGVAREGRRGKDGHIEIRRAGAAPIRFEPTGAIYTARQLVPMLGPQLLPTDGKMYSFKDEHCRDIAHVLLLAAGACEAPDIAQEAAGIVSTFMFRATPFEGYTTYGTTSQRYEAAHALRRDIDEYSGRPRGAARYLIDENTGEIVVRATDLLDAAREHVGSSLPHGWLDARMQNLGWSRATLEGRALPGREGRRGPHLRCDVYRGFPPGDDADEGSVTT